MKLKSKIKKYQKFRKLWKNPILISPKDMGKSLIPERSGLLNE